MSVAQGIYEFTSLLPVDERFGLVAQMRRAAISIPSNIAEGVGRSTDRDMLRFLYIARGSMTELDTQIRLCERLGFGSPTPTVRDNFEQAFAELSNLIKSLRRA
jgi:four helix bundle protein